MGDTSFLLKSFSFLTFQMYQHIQGKVSNCGLREATSLPLFSSNTGSSCFGIWMYSGSNPEGTDSPMNPKPEEMGGIQKEDD